MIMKQLLLVLTLAVAAFAQSTTFYTWNLQVSPVDTAVPVTTTLDGAVALANYLFANAVGPSTLNGSCASAATTCTLSSLPAGMIVGNGICFTSPCTVVATATGGPPPTTFTLSAGEIALVTAIAGNVVTLKRASIGTAAAYSSGQAVTVLVAGSYTQQTANIIAAGFAPIIQSCSNGAYTAATQCAAIAAAQASLKGAH